jgi:hypothetical protein
MSTPAAAGRLALASVAASFILAVIKISVGLAAHSVAVVSDGLENAATSCPPAGFGGPEDRRQAADDDHPTATAASKS